MEFARPESSKTPPGKLTVERFDHLVLWVTDIDRSARFYETICGMRRTLFDCGRVAMAFGEQKLNLNQRDSEGPAPAPLDFCLVTARSSARVLAHLRRHGAEIRLGPVRRTGALGEMSSIYVLDPDANVVELASYPSSSGTAAAVQIACGYPLPRTQNHDGRGGQSLAPSSGAAPPHRWARP